MDGVHVLLPKCEYCKDIIKTYDTFSGIPNKKFCLRCWHKIYDVWKAQNYLLIEPNIMDYVKQIKAVSEEVKDYYDKVLRD